ncbi:MAG: CBS and ACT domain-containing protein [Dissulfurimicrobium sp.]|uniref:CBS and ACT domain-containing protein n=1 Tax=Dissulfurimicrobium TaxID=1769732 RepID=UPI001EDBD798|nr:CBS and ACT domain-containing protein [Dissulfurimicrobium hydrothermale]UKL13269.1 CBS and ACT domain-containing protein [Dissulfurimicrobium hydrothermale]
MKVKNWMTKNVVTIQPEASLHEALELMSRHSIRHLPVVKDGLMQGLVTESNIRQYLYPSMLDELTVSNIMILNPITADPNASLDSVARLMQHYKIGGLPVLEKRQLVGIITNTDIVGAFIEFLGLLKKSSRLDVVLSEKDGALDDVIRLIREMGGKILSVVVDAQSPRKKVHYIRLEKSDLTSIVKTLEEKGHKVLSVLD